MVAAADEGTEPSPGQPVQLGPKASGLSDLRCLLYDYADVDSNRRNQQVRLSTNLSRPKLRDPKVDDHRKSSWMALVCMDNDGGTRVARGQMLSAVAGGE